MSIGHVGQFLFRFNIAGQKDFIEPNDLMEFSCSCEVGNILPQFILIFDTLDEDIIQYFNEGNELEISYGKQEEDLLETKLLIINCNITPMGSNKKRIYLQGLYSVINYFDNDLYVSGKTSGVQAIQARAAQFFQIDSNISTSSDSQNWIQHNTSTKQFINQLMLHSNVPDSFLAIGIDMDGKFILRDIRKKTQGDFDWRLIQTPTGDKDIEFDGDPVFESNFGFMNAWHGYKKEKLLHQLESGNSELISEDIRPLMALTTKLIRTTKAQKRFTDIGFQNANIHENYWQAFLRNMTYSVSFSAINVKVSFQDEFLPFKLLDLIMYKDSSIKPNQPSTDATSGLYLITKITRSINNNKLVTVLTLSREAFNQAKGDFQ
jgi:hypothetical protein